ncbi:hypothetical protein FKW77_005328 [Venturia effusa]|uniref:NAD(P)-binding protein n=1 Tax=Venturia effusa TaxID=50376 RepID=A0A517L1C5_9PEZI|nr:hypothetical protein FKW77_005328 [Venturia effusa]
MASPSFVPYTTPQLDFNTKLDLTPLKGKCALITGAASGLGAATAVALGKAGCYVTVVDLNEANGQSLVQEMEKENGINLLAAFKSAISFNPQKTLDIVIPFAGMMGAPVTALLADAPSTEDPVAPPMTTVDVNIKGVLYTTHLALHYFRQSPETEKNLVLISSNLAYINPPGWLDYTCSKEAVRGLFHALRYSSRQPWLGLPHLRTNLIAPGLIDTPMSHDRLPWLENEKGFAVGQPSDIVDVALRILTDKSIDGRAVCGGKDVAVDLCDDLEGQFGARECRKLIESGKLGWGPSKTGFFDMVG